jgi:hypothetical protein
MVEQLIEKVFALRNASHLAHWKTKSYSQHQALGEFYLNIIEGVDKYIEANQGVFGLIGEVPGEKENIITAIRDDLVWLNENREAIAKNIPALENILDELTGQYMTTLYKLENLR